MKKKLSHLDHKGEAHMVDVSAKGTTERMAVAEGRVHMSDAALKSFTAGNAKKGDVLGTARIAGIMAAKRTADLIPLCHPLPLTQISVDFAVEASGVRITAQVKTTAQTGVEMEALTAVGVAALALFDMLKAVDKSMRIEDIRVLEKRGGRSGAYKAK